MENKIYTIPSILEDLTLEMEDRVLASSNPDVDENIDHVDTMGQEVGGQVGTDQWSTEWK
ncbi:MAG: hypothetical protein IJ222_02055 [Bacteroidales bacterium]|nr:hypothetical protein [Bacteroidales bacterium]